jgi:hypothetical protein
MGRGKVSKIVIKSSFLSKQHLSIVFNESAKAWEIKDGVNNNPSLNGTWFLLNSNYELKEDTLIKIGNNVIRIGVE